MAALDVQEVSRVFGSGHTQLVALDDVSLVVNPGEFVAIMGPSGSGKSTLLRLAGGLDRPTSGRVLVGEDDLAVLSAAALAVVRRRRVGYVFQNLNLLASLTAAENVALPLELDGVKRRAAMASARSLLDAVAVGGLCDRFPDQLSGGEQQRVAIARAVAGDRSVLLADEPTGALDSLTGEAVMRLLSDQCTGGCAVVLVTHDARHAGWADRIVFLRDGKVVDETTPPAGPEGFLSRERVT
jgi:putative ABC transport system ATP-binding protein